MGERVATRKDALAPGSRLLFRLRLARLRLATVGIVAAICVPRLFGMGRVPGFALAVVAAVFRLDAVIRAVAKFTLARFHVRLSAFCP